METPPNCSSCQTPMVLKEKEGQKFWGCPNWKECGGKTIPFGGYKKKSGAEGFQKVGSDTQHEEIMKEFEKLNKRLDNLAQFLGENK